MEKFKNNLKEKFKNFKQRIKRIKENPKLFINYLKEKFNKNIFIIVFWGQFILTIVLTILLICSLVMANNLSKQLYDISNQINSVMTETDIDISSEVETETESTSSATSSSTESSNTSSTTISSSTTSSTESTTVTTGTSNSTESTNVTTGTTSDIDLLACVIYQEAGGNGSCDTCRRRIADVVLNRVDDPRFPNTIREVLTAKNQYGRYYYTGVVWPSRAKSVNEKDAVARAYRIAEEVLNGQHSELYGNGYI